MGAFDLLAGYKKGKIGKHILYNPIIVQFFKFTVLNFIIQMIF